MTNFLRRTSIRIRRKPMRLAFYVEPSLACFKIISRPQHLSRLICSVCAWCVVCVLCLVSTSSRSQRLQRERDPVRESRKHRLNSVEAARAPQRTHTTLLACEPNVLTNVESWRNSHLRKSVEQIAMRHKLTQRKGCEQSQSYWR